MFKHILPNSLGPIIISAAVTIPVAIALASMLCASPADAQQVYRYKDKSGQWVYADRPPDGQASRIPAPPGDRNATCTAQSERMAALRAAGAV